MNDYQPEWWHDFFSGSALDFVRQARSEEDTSEDAAFVQEALGLSLGSRILDVPCGGGRLSLALAERGYRVTGVDFSEPLLRSAQADAEARNLEVEWRHGDMRNLPWTAEFDGALCLWNSFGYFDEPGDADFLSAVSNALKPGAPFLLDTPLLETSLTEIASQDRVWWPAGDILALEDRSFDHANSRLHSEWTFVQDGRVESRSFSLRLYTYRELTQLLEQAGFGNHRAYASLDWEPFELGARWLYLVTTKMG